MTHTLKGMLILFAAVVIASTTFAFASSSTLVPGPRGEGAGGISGYAVSDIAYQFNADPSRIDAVMFTLDGAAMNVKISLDSTSSAMYNCSPLSGNQWICETAGASIEAADTLNVFAAGN